VLEGPDLMPAPKDPVRHATWIIEQRERSKGKKRPPRTKEWSDNISKAKKNPSEAFRKKMSEAMLKYLEEHPEERIKNSERQKGIPRSDEFKENRRLHMLKLYEDPAEREKQSERLSGENNPFFGKTHPDYVLEILKQPKSEDHKKKISATQQGVSLEEWKGYITPINHYVRTSPRYLKACSDAMKDAGYKDAFTGIKSTYTTPIECHHATPHNLIMRLFNITTKEDADKCDLLFDKHNLIVMLKFAHDKFHNLYGDDKNIYELTPDQITELYTQ
jgi:hypothetical protein